MSTSAKALRTILFTVLAMLAGFAAYQAVRSFHPQSAAAPVETASLAVPVASAKTYSLIQPSVGLLQVTVPARIERRDGIPYIVRAPDDTARLEVGMDAILYDTDENVLPVKSVVNTVRADGETLWIPPGNDRAAFALIVLRQHIMAKRLPLSARRGNAVWKAVPQPDGTYHLERRALSPTLYENADHFDVGDAVRADELVLLDPDDAVREGATVTAAGVIFNDAPVNDPRELARQQAYEIELAAAIAALPSPGPGACGVAAPLMQILNQPLPQSHPGPDVTCVACSPRPTQNP